MRKEEEYGGFRLDSPLVLPMQKFYISFRILKYSGDNG